jgi:hypothetical protein
MPRTGLHRIVQEHPVSCHKHKDKGNWGKKIFEMKNQKGIKMLKQFGADIKTGAENKETEKRTNALNADLDTALRTRSTLGHVGEQVGNVVPWVTVQASAESLLVEVVGNKTNATSEHEKSVEDTHLQVVLSLFSGESTRVAEEVNKGDSDTSVNVKNEVVLLGSCDSLDSNGVIQELVCGEVLGHVFLNQLDTEIRVVTRLDLVANTGNCLR